MTETQRNTLRIPSREEFHRYTSNLLTNRDFETEYPGKEAYQANLVSSALRWTIANRYAGRYVLKNIGGK